MLFSFSWWDLVLLVLVSLHATSIAYLHNQRHKAVVMTLPIPFTFATLAVGRLVDVTHLAGMTVLLVYVWCMRLFSDRWHLNVIVAIVLSLLVYIALGAIGEHFLPRTPWSFAAMAIVNIALGALLHFWRGNQHEKGYRSPLPLPIKLPAVMGVIMFLILIKRLLGGFATTFPMVTTVASYEMRHSLRSMQQGTVLLLITVTPFQVACYLTQDWLGLGGGLALGWLAWLVVAVFYLPGYLRQTEIESKALDGVNAPRQNASQPAA